MKILFLCVALALFPTPLLSAEAGSDGKILNGMAPLYLHAPSTDVASASALLSLPFVSTNVGWYANWVMIVSNDRGAVGFVQGGIIRLPPEGRTLYAFVAWQRPGDARITFKKLESLSDASHQVAITQKAEGYAVTVDGRDVASPIAMRLKRAYAQIGPEVYLENDQLSGTVSSVQLRSPQGSVDLPAPDRVCRYINHGVQLVPGTNADFEAMGVFARSQASRFMGDCSGF